MNQLLISVFCPAMSKSYDFWIPAKMKVDMVIDLICENIGSFESNTEVFANRNNLVLCSYLEKKVLDTAKTLEQSGIKSGDKLAIL